MEGASLLNTDFSGANMANINLRYAIINEGTVLSEKLRVVRHLTSVASVNENMRGVDLIDVNLSRAKMSKVDLTDASLRGSNLTGADLRGAILTNCDLRDVKLRYARLEGAYLVGADLRGADLLMAHISTSQLLSARSLVGARLPGGVTAEELRRSHKVLGLPTELPPLRRI